MPRKQWSLGCDGLDGARAGAAGFRHDLRGLPGGASDGRPAFTGHLLPKTNLNQSQLLQKGFEAEPVPLEPLRLGGEPTGQLHHIGPPSCTEGQIEGRVELPLAAGTVLLATGQASFDHGTSEDGSRWANSPEECLTPPKQNGSVQLSYSSNRVRYQKHILQSSGGARISMPGIRRRCVEAARTHWESTPPNGTANRSPRQTPCLPPFAPRNTVRAVPVVRGREGSRTGPAGRLPSRRAAGAIAKGQATAAPHAGPRSTFAKKKASYSVVSSAASQPSRETATGGQSLRSLRRRCPKSGGNGTRHSLS